MREKRYPPPGTAPGTLTSAPEGIVPKGFHVISYTPFSFVETTVTSVADLACFRDTDTVTWINVDGLGDANVIAEIGKLFDFHPLALEDALSVPQRPKVDLYGDHLFLVFRMLHHEAAVEVEQISLFLSAGLVVTFQEAPGDCLDPIRERLRKGVGRLRGEGADFLMYAILDAVIDNYFPFLERLSDVVEALEDEVVARPRPSVIARVHEVKRDLLEVRRSVWPLRDAISKLLREESALVGRTTRLYLRDCYDHTVHTLDVVENHRELVSDLMDVYLSSLSNRLNEVMKVLTVISTIFIPLTFIAGVYGMNFRHMPELDRPWAYPVLWVIMIAIGLGMLYAFWKKGWLGNTAGAEEPPRAEEPADGPPPIARG
jgi:magnesium transporter